MLKCFESKVRKQAPNYVSWQDIPPLFCPSPHWQCLFYKEAASFKVLSVNQASHQSIFFLHEIMNTFHSTSTDPSLVSFGVKTTKGSSLTAANTPAAYVLRRRWQTNKQTYWYHCTTQFAYQIEDCQIFPLPTVKEHFRWPLLCFHMCDGIGNEKVPDKSKAVVHGQSRDFHASAKSNWQLLWKQLFF